MIYEAWFNNLEEIPKDPNCVLNEQFYDVILGGLSTEDIGFLSRLWKELEDDGA